MTRKTTSKTRTNPPTNDQQRHGPGFCVPYTREMEAVERLLQKVELLALVRRGYEDFCRDFDPDPEDFRPIRKVIEEVDCLAVEIRHEQRRGEAPVEAS